MALLFFNKTFTSENAKFQNEIQKFESFEISHQIKVKQKEKEKKGN